MFVGLLASNNILIQYSLSLFLSLSFSLSHSQTVDYGTLKIGRSCLNPDHTPSNASISLEVFGSGSRCFDQSEPFVMTDEDEEKVTAETYGAGCYEVCV